MPLGDRAAGQWEALVGSWLAGGSWHTIMTMFGPERE